MKQRNIKKWTSLIAGIVFTLLGITMLVLPLRGLYWFVVFGGICLLAAGVFALISYFGADRTERSGWTLAGAIICLLVGLWFLFDGGTLALTLTIPYLFALALCTWGVIRIVQSISARKSLSGWGWSLALGIVVLVAGILLLSSPLMSAGLASLVLAFVSLGYGAQNIMRFRGMRRVDRYRDMHPGGDDSIPQP